MFRRRQHSTGSAPPPPPVEPFVPLDQYLGSTAARTFCAALRDRRYDALPGILEQCPTIEERSWVVQVAANDVSLSEEIRGWCSAQPSSGLPLTAWGASLVIQAWEVRGAKRASETKRADFELFHETLRRAEQSLHDAIRLSPTSPLPWIALLRSGRGLEISRHELRLRYEHAMARQAAGLDPHQQMLQAQCAKWGGSHEEMFDFARRVAADAAAGSPIHTILALAHLERGISGDIPLRNYMASVAGELRTIGEHSVEHPAFVDGAPDGARARNMMCLCYSLAGDSERSQQQRAAMNGRLARSPWEYLGEPEEVFRHASPRATT